MADVKEKNYNSAVALISLSMNDQKTTNRNQGYILSPYNTGVNVVNGSCVLHVSSLFNALTGLGGGGQVDPTTSAKSNAALHATFSVAAIFSGSINNKLGSRVTLLLASLGYALYIGSFLAMNIHPLAGPFVTAAGAILGVCAGLLWTAQGSLMLAYPTEGQKGKYTGAYLTWVPWSEHLYLKTFIQQLIPVSYIFTSNDQAQAQAQYCSRKRNIYWFPHPYTNRCNNSSSHGKPRQHDSYTDGTKVTTPRHPSWKVEIYGLWLTLRTDPKIILLFPMFLASNWFYTWRQYTRN